MAPRYFTDKHGDLTGIPNVLDSLNAPWRHEAACSGEEGVFFTEMSACQYKPYLGYPAYLLPMLICAGCPVRRPCLVAALTPPVFAAADDDWSARVQRVFGVWGGTTEYDRQQVRDLSVAEAVEILEDTFPQRMAERIHAWRSSVEGRPRTTKGNVRLSKSDRRILGLLGEAPPIIPRGIRAPRKRRSKLFSVGGKGGPGRGHRSKVGRLAAAQGISYATAWRRLRAQEAS